MAAKIASRRISSIRYVAPAHARSVHAPLGGVALLFAVTLAVLLLSVTISAAQALH